MTERSRGMFATGERKFLGNERISDRIWLPPRRERKTKVKLNENVMRTTESDIYIYIYAVQLGISYTCLRTLRWL